MKKTHRNHIVIVLAALSFAALPALVAYAVDQPGDPFYQEGTETCSGSLSCPGEGGR